MLGLIIAIIVFNVVAFTTNKRLTNNQILHIWTFTISFQTLADMYLDVKYQGYWYFTQEVELVSILNLTMLIPPVNMMFLQWYPFQKPLYRKILYFFIWTVAITCYEALSLLPEPWGYFHYGWWKLYYSFFVYPFLLWMVLHYYKWICKIEKKSW